MVTNLLSGSLSETVVVLQTGTVSETTIEAIRIALFTVFTPSNMVFLILATLVGLGIGCVPGLGGPTTLALLIPITFQLEPEISIMILAAALGGVNFGGSLSAILLNVPGSAPNAATLLDGYPLTKQGRSGEAISASAVSSACGAIVGVILLIALVPILRPIALAFGSVEMFWLALLGLAVIASVTTGSILSDLIAATAGLMFAFHGLNPVTGTARFTWNQPYLLDGIQLVPALIGLFAVAEMLHLFSRKASISETDIVGKGRIKGIKAVFTNRRLFMKSSIIGWLIGTIPGVGGTVANFVAYLQAKQTAADPSTFGHGDIRGVIASEASNDAKDGGSMVPTLVLGIPGSASTAVLIGGFLIHGITPGPLLIRDHLDMLFIVAIALVLSNILTSSIGIVLAEKLTKITRVRITTLAPMVLFIALFGSFILRTNFGDVVITTLFGIFGLFMIKFQLSRIIMVVALFLGPIAESNFHRGLQISGGDYAIFFARPLSLILILLLVVSLIWPVLKNMRR